MKPFILTLLSCAFTAAIASAEDKPKDGKDAPAPEKVAAMPDLTGTSWTLKSWSDKKLEPTKFEITAAFKVYENGKSYISGYSGVNQYTGFYEVKADGSFSVGSVGGTEIGGEGDRGHAEFLYRELLKQVSKYAIDGKKLVLSDKEGNELLVFEKSPEPIAK